MFRRTLLLLAIATLTLSAADRKTVWEGAYTADQAKRGETVYATRCARCHREDLSGYGGLLIGDRFMNDWREDTIDSFFTVVKQTMPRDAPSSLPDNDYLDLLAYVLRENTFPAGQKELSLDTMGSFLVQGKNGPEPVPDFALVEVVGCLVPNPAGGWMVKNASEPVRTRNPKESKPEELKSWERKALGAQTFALLDDSSIHAADLKGRKVDAKGLLIRKPGNDKLNPTSLQGLTGACQ
jgi:mono/diheme cytochrome c family protein